MSKRRREEGLPPWALILIAIVLAAVFIWRAVPKHIIYLSIGIAVVIIGAVSYLVIKKHGTGLFKNIGKKIYEGLKTRQEETQRQVDVVPPLTVDERAQLIDAVGGRCENRNCRNELTLEVHHIEPRAQGGSNKLNNLIVLCASCHNLADKGEPSKAQLREWIHPRHGKPRRFRHYLKWKQD